MNNPELYIFVALGFAFGLSWIVSKFSGLSIDLFNTSIGLLFGASANLALMANPAVPVSIPGVAQPALTDYALFLVFLQFAFGILIICSHFAVREFSRSQKQDRVVKIKEAIFYSWSFVVSLSSCYVMTVFFLNSHTIFAPLNTNVGELNIIIDRFLVESYVPFPFWIFLLIATAFVRYWRGPISSIAKP